MMSITATLRVGNLMTIDPITIGPDEAASEAERVLKTYRISGLPVIEDGMVVGVLSQTDLLTARSSDVISANWPRLRVRHLMTRPAMSVLATTSIEAAARQMIDRHVHRLVVVDDAGAAIGVLTPLDLMGALLDEADIA